MQQTQLIHKKEIAKNIFELHYSLGDDKDMTPGQFITFILPGIGGRAYSIAKKTRESYILIIKRWDKASGGRGGSMHLCDAEVGSEYKYVGPSGHFIIQNSQNPKLFIGTGTGLVPLYNMIHALKDSQQTCQLVFGSRNREDMYYESELKSIQTINPNFSYQLYLSRESCEGYNHGYVSDALTPEYIQGFEEFYLCGAPSMIESSIEKLTALGVSQKQIFFEKYA